MRASLKPVKEETVPMLPSAKVFAVAATVASFLIAVSTATAAAPPLPVVSGSPYHDGSAASGYSPGVDWNGPLSSTFGTLGSALVGSAPTGVGPAELAVDPATHTVYVTNGYNDNAPNPGGNTLSVIDTRQCQAQDLSRCRGPWPTITVGDDPSSIAVDVASDTVYVTNNGDNTVSVFNGATCNALNTSGCGQKPATVPVGSQPIGLAIDDANHTVYVPDSGDTSVSMIDSATCNASHLAGCPSTQPPTVNVGSQPFDAVVDQSRHTVYIGTLAAISVFDANTCSATQPSGCTTIATTLNGDPYSGPNGMGIDDANDTLYTANYDNTISAWNMQDCDASNLGGCAIATPGTVMPFPYSTGEHALYLAVDETLHSVYVTYQFDGALIVFDTNACEATNLSGCATLTPSAVSTGDEPEGVVLDPQTQTLYAANAADNDVSVIDATGCNASVTAGCRRHPPTVAVPLNGLPVADPAVNTLYAGTSTTTLAMINTQICNIHALAGCANTPAQVTVGAYPDAEAVDSLTHTVYVANFESNTTPGSTTPGTLSVFDADTCNATASAGCAHVSTLQVPGGNPTDVEVDAATDTVYVATITQSGPNLLSVFNGATCNAGNVTGCNQTPATLAFGDSGGQFFDSFVNIAVNQATNTIYATNDEGIAGGGDAVGDSIYVINGTTCDAAHHGGCGQTPKTITGIPVPWGVAVDEATDTVYVANWENQQYPGSVSVINGATCNSSNLAGCGQTPKITPAGFGDMDLAIDPTTNDVYTANSLDSSLSVINGGLCNGLVGLGCSLIPAKLAAGDYPGAVAVDPAVATAYVSSLEGVSVVPLVP
jgi:DNA-binding beta-propeller fold protein YncE